MARVAREAGILGLYLVLAVIATWPWAADLWSQAVGGDAAVYEWSFYWSASSAVGLNNPWFSPDVYAPEGSYLANHSLMLLPALLELPLYGALGPVRAYNVSVLIWLALAGYAGYRLAVVLVRHRAAAVAAGALYAMGPTIVFRTVQPGMVLLAVLLPFALLAARNLARRRTTGAAVVLGLVLAAVFLTDVLISAYVLIAMAGYAAVTAVRSPAWRTRRALMLTGVVLLAAALPSLGQIVMSVNAERADSYQTPARFAAASASLYGADAAQFVLPSVFSRHGQDVYLEAGDAFPGLLKRVNGPVSIGLATILLAGLGLAASWRSPPTRLLALAALSCLVLTLGPVVRVLGSEWRPLPVTYEGTEMSALMPYTWLVRTPFIRNVRVPDRFGVVAMLPLAMLAGLGADALLRRRRWWGPGAVAALVTLGVVEGRTPLKGELPIEDEAITAPIKADPNPDSLVVDVPVGWASGTGVTGQVLPAARAMLRGSEHRHPIASGYVARFSPERVKRLLAHPFYLELLRLQGRGRDRYATPPPNARRSRSRRPPRTPLAWAPAGWCSGPRPTGRWSRS